MSKYKLEESQDLPNWWVLTDTEALVVIKFEKQKFNETQKVTCIDEQRYLSQEGASNLARILREMADYMVTHWYSVAMPTPVYELRESDYDKALYLLRNKHPRLKIEIQDDATAKELSDALKKAGEYIIKRVEI